MIFSNSIIAHYKPNGGGKPSAPDIAIYPGLNIIPKPPVPPPRPRRRRLPMVRRRRTAPRNSRHSEIPPVDKAGRPHARIMCEVAVSQDLTDLEEKCKRWMLQQYIRCVFAIKIFNKDPTRIVATNQFNRRMIARLYTRQAGPLPNHVAVIGQRGVYLKRYFWRILQWEFGTLNVNGNRTTCTGLGLPAYQVNIPVQEVFWNPPINESVPSTTGYTIAVPAGVTANNFVIDLYRIQLLVLRNQSN